ncbi:MAG TPA: tetratricopeptide repeat protein [Desulfobulbus sp.]|nr:tetratricopeptide repeat protein [Desulfobulbus sp.]
MRRPWLPLLAGILLAMGAMVSGCAPHKVAAGHDREQTQETSAEERDYDCSYFYFLWGRYAELTSRFPEALEAYEKALICDPAADYIAPKIPVLLIRTGQDDKAVAWLERYLQEHPRDTGSRMLLAKILIRRDRFDAAVRQYTIILQQNPRDLMPLLLLSELYITEKKDDLALKTLNRALAIDPDSYPARVLLARFYVRTGKPLKALAEYRRALAINWSADLEMEMAELYMQQKEYDRAVRVYRRILEREENREDARIALVHVFLLQGREDQALAELNRLKFISQYPARVDLTIARIYARKKQYDKAVSILREVLKNENLPQARYLLALIEFQAKQYEDALVQLRQIGRDAGEYRDALFLRVRILRVMKREDDAIRLLEKAVADRKTRNPDMFILLAALYQQQGRGNQGEKIFARALAAFPDNEELLYQYGLFLDSSGESKRAMKVMQKVIRLQPEHAAALNYVGYTWADRKVHLDKALEYIRRAVKLKPENGYIRDSLGWVYFRLGRLQEARQELEKAIRLSPDDPAILDHLGDVYLALGRSGDALRVYRKALGLYKKEADRKTVQEKIRILEEQEAR